MPEKNKYFKKISKLLFLLILFTFPSKLLLIQPPCKQLLKIPFRAERKNGWYLQPVKITLPNRPESGIKE